VRNMAALILKFDNIWKGQNHTWSLYAWLNSPHYPLNARLGGPRIWNERFTEKNKFVAPFQDPTQNSSGVQHTAY
jgi:hypothetical protein